MLIGELVARLQTLDQTKRAYACIDTQLQLLDVHGMWEFPITDVYANGCGLGSDEHIASIVVDVPMYTDGVLINVPDGDGDVTATLHPGDGSDNVL